MSENSTIQSDPANIAPEAKPQSGLDGYFQISARGSTVKQEMVAGLTTFLAMVYSVIVVPSMLGAAGFNQGGRYS